MTLTYCNKHNDITTNLKCSRCDNFICTRCMNQTPVGIKCKDCASIGKPQILILSKTATFFILINSISGIIGQLTKNAVLAEIQNYWYLLLAVLIGGQIGNYLNLKIFPTRLLALVTAALVLFVAARIGIRLL